MKQTSLPFSSDLKALQFEKSPSRAIDWAWAPASGRTSAPARRRGARKRAAREWGAELGGMVRSCGMLFLAGIIGRAAGAATPALAGSGTISRSWLTVWLRI